MNPCQIRGTSGQNTFSCYACYASSCKFGTQPQDDPLEAKPDATPASRHSQEYLCVQFRTATAEFRTATGNRSLAQRPTQDSVHFWLVSTFEWVCRTLWHHMLQSPGLELINNFRNCRERIPVLRPCFGLVPNIPVGNARPPTKMLHTISQMVPERRTGGFQTIQRSHNYRQLSRV